MIRHIAALWCATLLLACSATHGEVEHPKAGEAGSAEYCGNNAAEENTCMHCTAKPGCGFCAAPKSGAPSCQPGTSADPHSDNCDGELSISSEGCPLPPPPAEQ